MYFHQAGLGNEYMIWYTGKISEGLSCGGVHGEVLERLGGKWKVVAASLGS